MNLPKISVITPSFNQGQFLEETLLSVINQNYSNLEYIVIDGGSTDNSVEIIKKYEQHLAFWISEKDSGQSEAINKGFKRATGDIICWLNSDDILVPDALNKVVNCFKENKDLDLLVGYTVIIDKISCIITGLFILKQKKWYAKHGIYYVNQPAMFWKRRMFETVGFLREDFQASMDTEFLIRIFEKNFNIGHLGKILAGFRVHSESKSAAGWNNLDYIRDLDELIKLYGMGYGGRPKLFFLLIYGFEKLIKGVYFKKWIFTIKWRGKSVNKLNFNSCKYL
jgi:glycosyltransferase involved in cell wall biosynthesis